jgi:hypothetical protein
MGGRGMESYSWRTALGIIEKSYCQAWWYTAVIPALKRLRQEDHKLKDNLSYVVSKY